MTEETKLAELKPCPFCKVGPGHEHFTLLTDLPDRGVDPWHTIHCEGCDMHGPVCATKAEAIAAWNTRPVPDDVAGVVERLRSSAKAFRENTVYDSEGDPLRLIVQAEECEAAAALLTSLASGRDDGWVIGNSDGTQWRTWSQFGPTWVSDITKATRYHRREDAEAVHGADEDAWRVVPFASPLPAPPTNGGKS